jgi:hypothetical protein
VAASACRADAPNWRRLSHELDRVVEVVTVEERLGLRDGQHTPE